MSARAALLAGIVDYAGLFPPAAVGMADAVRNYASYRGTDDAWMLGRFVLPVARLDEFAGERRAIDARGAWRLSALLGADPRSDIARVRAFNTTMPTLATVDTLEAKLASSDDIARVGAEVRGAFELFVELPLGRELESLVAAIRRAGAMAKVRTGGVTPDAFPASRDVIRFMRACLDAGVAFKATAGLHHPVRADYRLTYEPDGPRGTMFGYVNVFVAAALMANGMSNEDAVEVLEEREPAAFELGEAVVRWRDRSLSAEQVGAVRQRVAISFGSCSFREPVDEVRALGVH